jgi:hypothetical protein
MTDIHFKDYELTQMSQEEILDKAARLYSFMSDLKPNVSLQMCIDQVIRAYASYNPDEEKVGTYA